MAEAKRTIRVTLPAEKEGAAERPGGGTGSAAQGAATPGSHYAHVAHGSAWDEERALTPALVPLLAVGMTVVPGGVCLLNKDAVAYPVGRSIALYSNTHFGLSRVSEPLRQVRGITAITASPDKQYIAAAESMADGYLPQVTIFNSTTLERLAVLSGPHVTSSYTSLCFSGDSLHILACGSDDTRSVSVFHLFEWGPGGGSSGTKPSCSGEVAGGVIKALLDPKFAANVMMLCADDVGLWRQSTAGFKCHAVDGLELQPGVTYVDQASLPDGRFLVATSARQVMVVERTTAHLALTTDRPITCVLGLPDGSVAVGMPKGYLQLFKRAAGKEDDPLGQYAIFCEARLPDNAAAVSLDNSVRSLSVDAAGDQLACSTGLGPVHSFNTAYAKSSTMTADGSNDLWQMLLPGCHEQGIISASAAYKRDFFVTASKDLTVRVWRYEPLRLVLTHLCHNSPLAVAVDPYGRELVVTYVDGTRCYDIVEGMLMESCELRIEMGLPDREGASSSALATTASGASERATPAPGAGPTSGSITAGHTPEPGAGAAAAIAAAGVDAPAGAPLDRCSLVRYSPTGALIAVAGGPGGRFVYIYSTLTKRQKAVLSGHFEAISDMSWSEDGAYLATCGEGAVYTWAMDGYVRCQENTSKLYLNDALSCTSDFHTLVVGDSTQGMRILDTKRTPAKAQHHDESAAGGGGGSRSHQDGAAAAAAAAMQKTTSGGAANKLMMLGALGKAAGAGGAGTVAHRCSRFQGRPRLRRLVRPTRPRRPPAGTPRARCRHWHESQR